MNEINYNQAELEALEAGSIRKEVWENIPLNRLLIRSKRYASLYNRKPYNNEVIDIAPGVSEFQYCSLEENLGGQVHLKRGVNTGIFYHSENNTSKLQMSFKNLQIMAKGRFNLDDEQAEVFSTRTHEMEVCNPEAIENTQRIVSVFPALTTGDLRIINLTTVNGKAIEDSKLDLRVRWTLFNGDSSRERTVIEEIKKANAGDSFFDRVEYVLIAHSETPSYNFDGIEGLFQYDPSKRFARLQFEVFYDSSNSMKAIINLPK